MVVRVADGILPVVFTATEEKCVAPIPLVKLADQLAMSVKLSV